jgi:hypothetical protein
VGAVRFDRLDPIQGKVSGGVVLADGIGEGELSPVGLGDGAGLGDDGAGLGDGEPGLTGSGVTGTWTAVGFGDDVS